MKKYKCHKVVEAAKITGYEHGSDGVWLKFKELDNVSVSYEWLRQRVLPGKSPIGGYFVKYDDAYTSWSPADVFEEGYTALEEEADTANQTVPGADYYQTAEYQNKQWRERALDMALRTSSITGKKEVLAAAAEYLRFINGGD